MSECDLYVESELTGKNYLNKKNEEEIRDPEVEYNQSRNISHPVWTYLKWFFWTAISGIFNCGVAVLEAPFSVEWIHPETPIDQLNLSRQHNVDSYSENGSNETTSASLKSCDSGETYYDPWCDEPRFPKTLENRTWIDNDQLRETLALGVQTHQNNSSLWYVDSLTEFEENLRAELNFDSNKDLTNFDLASSRNGIFAEPQIATSAAFTLIQAYHSEHQNGIIDSKTYDSLVKQLIQSVIPRNLSDCGDTSVSPSIRKMYAWTDLPPDSPTKIVSDENQNSSCEPFVYPGKLTMSDSSYSPLSPATAESENTITEDNIQESRIHCDFHLPTMARHDQTLAWAMANLSNPLDANLNLDTRQSRDKSPARTINSIRLGDTHSMPTFEEFTLLAESSRSFSEAEDIKPKRSSSLKSNRTPPGTPGQKAVRFADAFGLDLATVRHVFDGDNPPKIPASATSDLKLDTDESIAKLGAKQFSLCFAQPMISSSFIHRVLAQNVCLEDAHVEMPRGVLTGTIRVKNLGFEKHVYVRITYNNWATHCDVPASYVYGSYDGATDRFSFSVVFPDTMVPGSHALFAIRYDSQTKEQFWDNNHGQDYKVTCYAKATDLAGDGSWVHYL